MFRMISFAGLALMAFAGTANAAVHEVVITGSGFFPTKTHLRSGDWVVFHNEAEAQVNVIAEDADDETDDWATGDIDPGEDQWVRVFEESILEFEMFGQRWVGGQAQGEGMATETEGSEASGGYWENFTAQGEFTFDAVVLN